MFNTELLKTLEDSQKWGVHCKKNYEIPGFILAKPSWDRDWANYSRPGRVLLVTSRLGTGISQNLFYSVVGNTKI